MKKFSFLLFLILTGRTIPCFAQTGSINEGWLYRIHVERISFRTGAYRDLPNRHTPNQKEIPPLEGADELVPEARYYVDDLTTELHRVFTELH